MNWVVLSVGIAVLAALAVLAVAVHKGVATSYELARERRTEPTLLSYNKSTGIWGNPRTVTQVLYDQAKELGYRDGFAAGRAAQKKAR